MIRTADEGLAPVDATNHQMVESLIQTFHDKLQD